ncbi:hypothetical protein GINT2_001316 [Glugoides intestinalis]
MTATETTKKPFDNISRKLTFKDLLLTSFSGSLFNTAMFIVAPIFIFLAIIWLYYRDYYFKALGIMKTVGLLVSSGILFGVTFKVLLTTIRVFAGSYGCVNCSNVKLILTLVVTVSIMFLSLSLLFRKESHKSIGLIPKQATATDGTVESVEKDELAAQSLTVDKDALAKAARAVFKKAVQDAQAVQDFFTQAVRDAQDALAKAKAVQAVLEQAVRDAQAQDFFTQAVRDAQDALAQAEDAKAVRDAKAVLEQAVRDAQDAQVVLEQAVGDALVAQAALAKAQAKAQAKAALAKVKAALAQAQAKAALDAQKTPQGQKVVPADSASLPKAANN